MSFSSPAKVSTILLNDASNVSAALPNQTWVDEVRRRRYGGERLGLRAAW